MQRFLVLAVSALFVLTAANAQTIQIGANFPVNPPHPPEDTQCNVGNQVHNAIWQTWLDAHPGVSVEEIDVNIWDQQVILTAISGGIAPTFFSPGALAGWDDMVMRGAFKQGLAADITDELEANGVNDSLPDYVEPLWEQWPVEGQYYAFPLAYRPGNGVYYRKDLIQELGLEEPQPGWTWDDFRELAAGLTEGRRKGAAMLQWNFETELLDANQFGLLTRIPAPETSWNWRYDFTSNVDHWAEIVTKWRQMIYEDGSVYMDATNDDETRNAFVRGDVAMMINNPSFYTGDPGWEGSIAALADSVGKPLEEVVGWIELPVGELGAFGSTQPFISAGSVSPDASEEVQNLAIDLYEYWFLGEGYERQRQEVYERTLNPEAAAAALPAECAAQEEVTEEEPLTGEALRQFALRKVYNAPFPVYGMEPPPGVEGTFAEAWGEEFLANLEAAASIPVIPNPAQYIPAEESPGPGMTALNDALNRLIFAGGEVDVVDVAAELRRAEETLNQQLQSFSSTVPDDAFIEGARAYYEALDAFWQEHAPEFYAEVYAPWFEANVAPVLGEQAAAR